MKHVLGVPVLGEDSQGVVDDTGPDFTRPVGIDGEVDQHAGRRSGGTDECPGQDGILLDLGEEFGALLRVFSRGLRVGLDRQQSVFGGDPIECVQPADASDLRVGCDCIRDRLESIQGLVGEGIRFPVGHGHDFIRAEGLDRTDVPGKDRCIPEEHLAHAACQDRA